MRYQDELTLQEAGEVLGITPEAVRQKQTAALKEMRRPSRMKHLRPFVEDRMRSMALVGNGVGSFKRSWTSSTERVAITLVEEEREYQEMMDRLRRGGS